MIELKPFNVDDWVLIRKWVKNEKELVQFAGTIFTFPIDKIQVKNYLSEPNRTVFKIEFDKQIIGMAEISIEGGQLAKLARVLIGEASLRGKGVGTELINKLTDYAFDRLNKSSVILNVFTWNVGAIKCYEKAGFTQTKKPPFITKIGTEEWVNIEMIKVK